MTPDELKVLLETLWGEAAVALAAIVFALWVRDATNKFAKGLMFRFSPHYAEGDQVKIDGEEAVITKIGLFNTTFSIVRECGTYWRIIPNDRLGYLKVEKQVR